MKSNKISFLSVLTLLFVAFTSMSFSQTRFKPVAAYIENTSYSSTCQNCVTVSLKVEYTYNGQTNYSTSNSVVMNGGDNQFFVVNIPQSATVVAKEFVFVMDNGTVMHDFATSSSESYPAPGNNWCSCSQDPTEYYLVVDATSGTNQFHLAAEGVVGGQ